MPKKMADRYIGIMNDEQKNTAISRDVLKWAHPKGFFAENAVAFGLNDQNYTLYMSDYEYHRIWPINNWQRIWINDKMTLKYMLQGTACSDMMLEYYLYMSSNGLCELVDNPRKGNQDMDILLDVLREKGKMVCKPNNGSLGIGFFALEYRDSSGAQIFSPLYGDGDVEEYLKTKLKTIDQLDPAEKCVRNKLMR